MCPLYYWILYWGCHMHCVHALYFFLLICCKKKIKNSALTFDTVHALLKHLPNLIVLLTHCPAGVLWYQASLDPSSDLYGSTSGVQLISTTPWSAQFCCSHSHCIIDNVQSLLHALRPASHTQHCNASLQPDTFYAVYATVVLRDQIGLHSPHRSMHINDWWGLITHNRRGGLYTCMNGDNASCEFLMAAVLWAAMIGVFMWILFCMAVFVVNWLSLINELARSPLRLCFCLVM